MQPPIGNSEDASACLATPTHPAHGTLFPQPWILRPTGKQRLDRLAGCGWRLVLAGGVVDALRAHANAVAGRAGLTLIDLAQPDWTEADGVVASWMARHQAAAALVRPDHYVFGVSGSVDELDAQLAQMSAFIGRER